MSRKRACLAVVAQFMVWLGTVGLVYLAVPELAPVYLTDNQGTGITDDMGNRMTTGADPDSAAARWRYDVWATISLIPITLGMGLQVWEPLTTLIRKQPSMTTNMTTSARNRRNKLITSDYYVA